MLPDLWNSFLAFLAFMPFPFSDFFRSSYFMIQWNIENPWRRYYHALKFYDITIVGGGPVGLFAAYGNMRQVKSNWLIPTPQLGGQPAILYPEKYPRCTRFYLI